MRYWVAREILETYVREGVGESLKALVQKYAEVLRRAADDPPVPQQAEAGERQSLRAS